ncbi:MAG: acyl-CoA/acyl-ACP dehydrogenase [Hahellaceae bacterium]|nr:acyl-CoA/acyl-ACP dehydrogenase [Hahellaceae bacterium]
MAKDPIGFTLSAVNKFAGSTWVDKLGLRKPAEKIAYYSTRTGFQVINTANDRFQKARQLIPIRLSREEKLSSPLFDLSLTEEQQLICDSLNQFAREILRPQASSIDEYGILPDEIREQARALGLVEAVIPEVLGGYASKPACVTSTLIAERLAWGDMGIALALLGNMSTASALVRWGTPDQQQRWLPTLLNHPQANATIASNEPRVLFTPNQLTTTLTPSENGYKLSGLKCAVPMAEDADIFLVTAQTPNGRTHVAIVDAALKGISIARDNGMGVRGAQLCEARFEQVEIDESNLLGTADFNYQDYTDLASLALCGLAIGTCQAVLDYVIPYCNERYAFGEPISHRQSVAFIIANMGIELESMRLLTQRAASRYDQKLPSHREIYLARVLCAEKAMEIATQGVQLLGGHGFIKEHPVEHWYRDLRIVASLYSGLHA